MEGKKASVHIGDKQPIPTRNTFLGGGAPAGGSTYYPMVSYTYKMWA